MKDVRQLLGLLVDATEHKSVMSVVLTTVAATSCDAFGTD
jgi:hypothetical protein